MSESWCVRRNRNHSDKMVLHSLHKDVASRKTPMEYEVYFYDQTTTIQFSIDVLGPESWTVVV